EEGSGRWRWVCCNVSGKKAWEDEDGERRGGRRGETRVL
ncbi:hypothetical protein Tco_1277179, partial [Tanacetum coccineum]